MWIEHSLFLRVLQGQTFWNFTLHSTSCTHIFITLTLHRTGHPRHYWLTTYPIINPIQLNCLSFRSAVIPSNIHFSNASGFRVLDQPKNLGVKLQILLCDWLVQDLQGHPRLVTQWSCSGPDGSKAYEGPVGQAGTTVRVASDLLHWLIWTLVMWC